MTLRFPSGKNFGQKRQAAVGLNDEMVDLYNRVVDMVEAVSLVPPSSRSALLEEALRRGLLSLEADLKPASKGKR